MTKLYTVLRWLFSREPEREFENYEALIDWSIR